MAICVDREKSSDTVHFSFTASKFNSFFLSRKFFPFQDKKTEEIKEKHSRKKEIFLFKIGLVVTQNKRFYEKTDVIRKFSRFRSNFDENSYFLPCFVTETAIKAAQKGSLSRTSLNLLA